MKTRLLLVIISCWCCSILFAQEPVAIGQWTDHLPYSRAIAISPLNTTIVAATPYAIYRIDTDENSIRRKSKVSGLSGSGIAAMETDLQTETIVVAYKDANIDLIKGERVFNIDDIREANLFPSPRIYSIYVHTSYAYICASYGISVIDLQRREIIETYRIGNNGEDIAVYDVAVSAGRIFAATAQGLKSASLSASNLQDFREWNVEPSLKGHPMRLIESDAANVFAERNDSIFTLRDNDWSFLYYADRISGLGISGQQLLITQNAPASRIIRLSYDGAIIETIQHPHFTATPHEAISFENEIWIADSTAGVSRFTGSSFVSANPSSPAGIVQGKVLYADKKIFATAGGMSNNQPRNLPASLYTFSERQWTTTNGSTHPILASANDLNAIAFNKTKNDIWLASFGDGLFRLGSDKSIQQFKEGSFLSTSLSDPNAYNVSGLAFDNDGVLWISNSGATESIIALKPDGTVQKFRPPFALNRNAVADIVIDDANQKWIISPGNGLLILNSGQLGNANDDQWRLMRTGVGAGNLPTNEVLSLSKDAFGFIWVGTSSGIGIYQCTEQVFTNEGCEALLPVVQEGTFAGYLFKGEAVQSIEVDGANRKWIGTRNGAWLISEDGDRTIQRFTTDNSPLPDNNILDIEIDRNTGEVYFATDQGLCSYRGTSTGIEEPRASALVFPNPVPPGFEGIIAIRGVPANSLVKITELNGRLVYQTNAQGQQAVWNGRDHRGRKISTGVYLVFARSTDGKETLVTKIAFISK